MKKIFLALFTTLLLAEISTAQSLTGTVSQDTKVSNLLEEKRKINSKITINNTYKIQIYHGNIDGAKKALTDFTLLYNDIDATIIFVTPNYKVWVGSYKNRIEANKALNEIKKSFARALIIRTSFFIY